MTRRLTLLLLLLGFTVTAHAADPTPPLRVLLVCGGCCHDYKTMSKQLADGLAQRANIVVTVALDGADRNHKHKIYANPDWARGYDAVIHDECFGYVDDVAFVDSILKPHAQGLPAVVLHCAVMSYRNAKTNNWHDFVGASCPSHENRQDLHTRSLPVKNPALAAIAAALPAGYTSRTDELYKIQNLRPTLTPIVEATGVHSKTTYPVVWTNLYHNHHNKTRVFCTSLGHAPKNITPAYLDLVTRGLLWATGHLNPDGTPATGYGPGGK